MNQFRRGVPRPEDKQEPVPEDRMTEATEFILKSFRYQPRKSEEAVIVKIRATVDKIVEELFGQAERVLERFYSAVRTKGPDGEWVTDSHGDFVEDWSKLDGMRVEEAINAVHRAIYDASDLVSEMYSQTTFAYHVQEDEYWDEYRKLADGTINDRTAMARRHTRDSRFYYYYRWWVWKRVSDKLEMLKETKRTLEFMRNRFLKSEWGH